MLGFKTALKKQFDLRDQGHLAKFTGITYETKDACVA
jgi:hypothetical protein